MPLYMAAIEQLEKEPAIEGVHRVWRPDPVMKTRVKPQTIESVLELARQIPTRIRMGYFEAVQARTKKAAPWDLGPDVTRTSAQITTGNRFQPIAPILTDSFGAREDDAESEMAE